jgi:hypothetical protein
MKKKFLLAGLILFNILATQAQSLSKFTLTMQPGKAAYLSLENKQAYAADAAAAVKSQLDLVLLADTAHRLLEWYNLRPQNENIPAALTGCRTGVAAISFDEDQFEKCKTSADLSRMTGHLSKNSFSHFATISDGAQIDYHCFILLRENGKKALLWISRKDNGVFAVTVKLQS